MKLSRKSLFKGRQPQKLSTDAPVYDYRSKRSTSSDNLGRNQTITPQKRSWLHKLPSYLAAGGLIIAIGYSLILNTQPRIIIENRPGSVHRNLNDYQQQIEQLWSNSLTSRSKLTINSRAITDDIKNRFPELAAVDVELPLIGRRPTVRLTPAVPALILDSSGTNYYIDQGGKVLATTTDLQTAKLANTPIVEDATGSEIKVGDTNLPSSEVTFITRLSAELKLVKQDVKKLELPAKTANEVDVYLGGKDYFLKFNIESDVQQAVGSYLAAIKHLNKQGPIPSSYIDLRVQEKVFYK